MTTLSWNEIGSDKKKIHYIKGSLDEQIKLRPLGNPVCLKKYIFKHGGRIRTAVCLDVETCPVAKKYNITPQDRCAINVIDRRYDILGILEASPAVFSEMKRFFEKTGKNPGGTDGAHYLYTLKDGLKGRASYKIEFAGPNTLSEADISLIKSNGLYLLKKIYKAVDPNEIEKVLFGDIEGFKENEKINIIDDKFNF